MITNSLSGGLENDKIPTVYSIAIPEDEFMRFNIQNDGSPATVSYVGKANYKEAEEYIRDFRTWTNGSANFILIEIAAVNGRFTLDFLQPFKSPLHVNAFLKELEDNDITYDLQGVMNLEMPAVKLPWR